MRVMCMCKLVVSRLYRVNGEWECECKQVRVYFKYTHSQNLQSEYSCMGTVCRDIRRSEYLRTCY